MNAITKADLLCADDAVDALAGALCLQVVESLGEASDEIVQRIPLAAVAEAKCSLPELIAVYLGKRLPKGASTISSVVTGVMCKDTFTYRCRVW